MMNETILWALLAVVLCGAAGTLLMVQPIWFWRLTIRDSGSSDVYTRQRAADLRLLREDRAEFNRRYFATVIFMRWMAVIWYGGALLFLLDLLTLLFPA